MPGFFPRYHTPDALQALMPGLLWRVKTEEKKVFLTFDDGPHPAITPWVLEQLKIYNAKATFFCVGNNITKYPETFHLVKQEGHQVANHTYNHLDIFKNERNFYLQNVAACEQHTRTKLFRPPYGKLTLPLFFDLRKSGYTIVMWDLLSRDFEKDLPCNQSLATMLSRLAPGSIPLFHDSEKAFGNLKNLLPKFLSALQDKGYTFGTL